MTEKQLEAARKLYPCKSFDKCSINMKCFDCVYLRNGGEDWICNKKGEIIKEPVLKGGNCDELTLITDDVEKCWEAVVSVVAPLFNLSSTNFFSHLSCKTEQRQESWALTIYLMLKLSRCNFLDLSDELSIPIYDVIALEKRNEERIAEDDEFRKYMLELMGKVLLRMKLTVIG